ncbi:hypothetical protein Tco_1042951 [Tanacetum coccineum]|uniref:Uncharacterized protein n=1 Tax=Tanacetum coccineum TaxID=301880 RepID=A0ABQ5GLW7_9ASTR
MVSPIAKIATIDNSSKGKSQLGQLRSEPQSIYLLECIKEIDNTLQRRKMESLLDKQMNQGQPAIFEKSPE